MKFISSQDYKDATTGKIDWKAYKAAERELRKEEKARGERCSRCGAYMLSPQGHPRTCVPCQRIDEPAELDHDHLIRCPFCGKAWRPEDLYAEGCHEVLCDECDHRFVVQVHVSYSYTSPALDREP